MKITESAISYTYIESKRVYENNLPFMEAAVSINKKCDIKITSAKDYPYYFKYLITGIGSCRILSRFNQEYYLKKIHEDYGTEQLKKSLTAFMQLIDRFEKQNRTTKNSMRIIFDKYSKFV